MFMITNYVSANEVTQLRKCHRNRQRGNFFYSYTNVW